MARDCSKCKLQLPLEHFKRKSDGAYTKQCKECLHKRDISRYTPEQIKQKERRDFIAKYEPVLKPFLLKHRKRQDENKLQWEDAKKKVQCIDAIV